MPEDGVVQVLIYRVSQKSAPCVNENNSRNICSCGKNRYFRNLRHVIFFLIYSGVNEVFVVGTGLFRSYGDNYM